jgi:hypothetical protein
MGFDNGYVGFIEEEPRPPKPLDLWGDGRVETENSMHLNIELSPDEYDLLCLMCGLSMGTMNKQANGDYRLFYAAVRLTNRLLAGSPNFVPYAVPDEEK